MKLITSQEDFELAKGKDLIKLECYQCHQPFSKNKGQVKACLKSIQNNDSKRAGKYCSQTCQYESQKTGEQLNCKNCGKSIYVIAHDILSNKNHFCCQSCAAIFNNKITPKRLPQGSCEKCSKIISTSRKFCEECFILDREEKKLKTQAKNETEEWRTHRYESQKKAIMTYYKKNKLKMIEYKGGKCLCCGYGLCPSAMDFHHLDPSKKDFALSGSTMSFEKAKPELDKCVLLCCRCHREVHAGLITLPKPDSAP